jgi:hypothetical protein
MDLAGVVVADGIGSHYRAEVASQFAACALRGALERTQAVEINFPELFSRVKDNLNLEIEGMAASLPVDLDWDNAFGTTVLCAVDQREELTLAYVGNGAIFHIRGNFNGFPTAQSMPWNALNYLNPHSLPKNGKNLIYKLLSPRCTATESRPTVLSIHKDNDLFGDIILVCSDGIYSFDQTPIGKDDAGALWISGEETMRLFFDSLNAFFTQEDYGEAALAANMNQYLEQVRAENLMNDDCTVGVLITAAALRYQQSLRVDRAAQVTR